MLKEVVLFVAILTGERPISHTQPMPSLEACWDAAKEFTDRALPDEARKVGAVGLMATCAWREKPSIEN